MKYLLSICFVISVVESKALGSNCNIVSMKDWDTEESHRTQVLASPVKLLVVSHTVTPECNSDQDCESMLRRVRKAMIERGFDDIPHSFYVGNNGKVYEGAGWKHVGAHTKGYNTKSIGISFIGDFRDKLPSSEALEAAKALLKCGTGEYLTTDYHLVGHSQLSYTQSPGATLQTEIETWDHWTNDKDIIDNL